MEAGRPDKGYGESQGGEGAHLLGDNVGRAHGVSVSDSR